MRPAAAGRRLVSPQPWRKQKSYDPSVAQNYAWAGPRRQFVWHPSGVHRVCSRLSGGLRENAPAHRLPSANPLGWSRIRIQELTGGGPHEGPCKRRVPRARTAGNLARQLRTPEGCQRVAGASAGPFAPTTGNIARRPRTPEGCQKRLLFSRAPVRAI
jgi:hypothetical protein